MPAAAVIPAPIAYIKVVAVKKLVVGSRAARSGSLFNATVPRVCGLTVHLSVPLIVVLARPVRFTLKKLECSKQVCA